MIRRVWGRVFFGQVVFVLGAVGLILTGYAFKLQLVAKDLARAWCYSLARGCETANKKKKKKHLPSRTIFSTRTPGDAEVAQLVEQGTENPRVGSSILSLGTIK